MVCGNCELNSGTEVKRWIGSGFNVELKRPTGLVLGQIMDNGDFLIKRGGENYTRLTGDSFTVLCGRCNEKVYERHVPSSVSATVVNSIHAQVQRLQVIAEGTQEYINGQIRRQKSELGWGTSGLWGTA